MILANDETPPEFDTSGQDAVYQSEYSAFLPNSRICKGHFVQLAKVCLTAISGGLW